jgi:hypothetical protein
VRPTITTADAGVFTPIASVVVATITCNGEAGSRKCRSITSFSSRSRSALWNATPPYITWRSALDAVDGSAAGSSAIAPSAGGRPSVRARYAAHPVVSPFVSRKTITFLPSQVSFASSGITQSWLEPEP